MDLRIFTEPQQGAAHADLLRVATAAEELGFDGFFRSDHYLKMGDVDGLPGPSDAWLTLAALARETRRLRLGTLVSPATFRLPGPLAISVAQVDEMSGGRVELGLGAGWYEAEHTAYGIPFPDTASRFDRFAEQVQIVHGLLNTPAGETFDFAGEHYRLAGSPALPKPVQSRVPLILGGAGKKRGAELAARYADEFNVAFRGPQPAGETYARVRTAAERTGRDVRFSVAHVLAVGRDEAEVRRRVEAIGHDLDELRGEGAFVGTPDEVVERIGAYRELGASRAYLQVLDLADLDHLELVAARVSPQL